VKFWILDYKSYFNLDTLKHLFLLKFIVYCLDMFGALFWALPQLGSKPKPKLDKTTHNCPCLIEEIT
jgi:hypothetical protein